MTAFDHPAADDPSPAQLQNLLAALTAELREDPDNIQVRLELAETLRLLGREREAIAFYSNVAWMHAVIGNLPQAITLCKQILELAPEHRETQEMLAKLFASERVRKAKGSVPVKQVGGRWVLDPRRRREAPPAPPAATEDLPPGLPVDDEPPAPRVDEQRVVDEPPPALPVTELAPATPAPAPAEPAFAPDPGFHAEETLPATPNAIGGRSGAHAVVAPAPDRSQPALAAPDPPDAARSVARTTRPYAAMQAKRSDAAGLAAQRTGPDRRPAVTEPPAPGVPAIDAAPPAPAEAAGARPPRMTAPMPDASLNTLLRQDAELSYLQEDGARVTECQAAIEREVRARGSQQHDVAPAPAEEQRVARELRDTLRDFSARDTEREPQTTLPIVPLFSALDTPAFLALVARLDRRCFAAGSTVFTEGEEGDSLMIVSAGHLQVLKRDDQQQIELARLGPGSFFGELALLADQRRHATVRCLDDCELLELRKEVLARLTREHPAVATTLRAFYQQRVLEMVLATSPLFRPLAPDDRERVIARFTPRRFVAREQIIVEGGASSFYIVLLGEVEVTCKGESGEELVVATLSEGDYFGEMALISGRPAEASVRATRATETLTLDGRDFYELAAAHPEIWAEVQRESRSRQQLNARLLAAWKAGALLL